MSQTNSPRAAAPVAPERPHFAELETNPLGSAPPLHLGGARTLARDRWERLVTTREVPAEPDTVWSALLEPDSLRLWLAVCHGSLDGHDTDVTLDFEDGEFFLCRPKGAGPTSQGGYELKYLWRWLGIGQASAVTWRLDPTEAGTQVTVTEEAFNPPADWQTWNGDGWRGILDQLAAHLRTGGDWRWPWRRMGPYVQFELPARPIDAWEHLTSPAAIKYWLQRTRGQLESGDRMSLVMGDASGPIDFLVRQVVDAGQSFPSYLPYVDFALTRPVWRCEVGGRLWIEPAGWARSVLQVFHYNWENLPPELQLSERRIVCGFWTGAMLRAGELFGPPTMSQDGGSPWS
jgi:uncharacterized protein YndB with AHSA1/START domain